MATLREFILNQSTLPTGNTVRDHILHPGTGGGGLTLIVGEVEVDVDQDVVEVGVIDVVSVDVGPPDLVDVDVIDVVAVETESDEITVETCE